MSKSFFAEFVFRGLGELENAEAVWQSFFGRLGIAEYDDVGADSHDFPLIHIGRQVLVVREGFKKSCELIVVDVEVSRAVEDYNLLVVVHVREPCCCSWQRRGKGRDSISDVLREGRFSHAGAIGIDPDDLAQRRWVIEAVVNSRLPVGEHDVDLGFRRSAAGEYV